ncbi:MAG: hypothetical protein QOE96_3501 [Blastocatellia bacterium]|jgi:hypothetical protein|nr:hypothetical protein [Blastocatellia bacterium]
MFGIERSRGFRFTSETLHPLMIRCEVCGQNLQRYLAIEFRILRQIHLAHPARADL